MSTKVDLTGVWRTLFGTPAAGFAGLIFQHVRSRIQLVSRAIDPFDFLWMGMSPARDDPFDSSRADVFVEALLTEPAVES